MPHLSSLFLLSTCLFFFLLNGKKINRDECMLFCFLAAIKHRSCSISMFMWSMTNAKVIWTIVMKCVHWQHIITATPCALFHIHSWYVPNVRIKWCTFMFDCFFHLLFSFVASCLISDRNQFNCKLKKKMHPS